MLTKTELIALWRKYAFKPRKRYGQNFLIDQNIKNKIISFIKPSKNDTILEIGPGFGELTADLADLSRTVIAVEKDKILVKILRLDIFRNTKNIKIVEDDILYYSIGNEVTKIVGNLPYYITTPIIEKILKIKKRAVKFFCMVQKEYANRLIATAGQKDYSSLSCFVQYHAEVKPLAAVRRSCFFPEPEVDSVFLRISCGSAPKFRVHNEKLLFTIIRKSFQQRRKTLVNGLRSLNISGLDRDACRIMLTKAGIRKDARPESVSLEKFIEISDMLSEGRS